MQAYFGGRAHFDELSAILDSNSEEVWRETKQHPGEKERQNYELIPITPEHTQNPCTAG